MTSSAVVLMQASASTSRNSMYTAPGMWPWPHSRQCRHVAVKVEADVSKDHLLAVVAQASRASRTGPPRQLIAARCVRAVRHHAPLVANPALATTRAQDPDSGLREWQLRALAPLGDGPFLISAAPGAGKTRPRSSSRGASWRAGLIDAVVVACPTAPLTRQWARAAARARARAAPDADSPRPPAGFTASSSPTRGSRRRPSGGPRAAAAHARDRRRGPPPRRGARLGRELRAAFAGARWLLLSGTPFRSDATRRSRASATTPTASPSRTSPTPTPRRSATASAGPVASSPTTGRCPGAAATT
jgi:hypothetical protein